MFSPASLIQFLDHRSRPISRAAARYFVGAHDPAPATPSVVWNAIGKLGALEGRRLIPLLGRLDHDAQDLDRLVQALFRTRDDAILRALSDALTQLPVPVLREFLTNNEAREKLPTALHDRLKQRVDFADLGFDELWKDLVNHHETLSNASIREADLDTPKDLVRALAVHTDPSAARCSEVFADSSLKDSWLHTFAVELAGVIRLEAAAPHLLDLLAGDGDYINDRAVIALVRIGTPDVVRQTAARFFDSNDIFRIYSPAVLDNIKLPESETAALGLLRETQDFEDRSRLALTLFSLCTTEGFDDLHRITATGDYTDMLGDLEEEMYVLCTMQNRKVPELETWRSRSLARVAAAESRARPAKPTKGSWRSTSKKTKKQR
jgi:HEAT repeat protein